MRTGALRTTMILAILMGMLLSAGGALAAEDAREASGRPEQDAHNKARRRIQEAEALARIKRVIIDNYPEKVDEKKLFYGSLRGMFNELDPHSQFLTPEEFKEITASTAGQFGGLGIEVTLRDGWLTVVTPLMGTPAFKAGVLPGDRIVKIDGEATDRMTLGDAVRRMRGRPGTEILLGIARRGENALLEVKVVREIIKVDSVRIAHFVEGEDKIGYVSVTSFQADTAEELSRAVLDLEKQGLRALIIDLRANGGGRMDAAVKFADLFLEAGVIVSTRGRPGSRYRDEVFKAGRLGTRPDYPMAVLVNQSSASASEIVAGALRDHNRAILVGERTFGKASVQTLQRVRIGDEIAGLKLTTAHYYTPSGQMIHGKGIDPDVLVPMEVADLVEVLKAQHDEWVKGNDPNAEQQGAADENTAPESEQSPAAASASASTEASSEKKKVVDVQLEAAVRALRAVLIDRQRGELRKVPVEQEATEAKIPEAAPVGAE